MFETFILNSEITEVSFNISIINDNVTEGDETFLVGVSSLIEFEIDVQLPESSVVLIADDDELISDVQSMYVYRFVCVYSEIFLYMSDISIRTVEDTFINGDFSLKLPNLYTWYSLYIEDTPPYC